MSQPPQQPFPPASFGPTDPRIPGRRASLAMIILGLCGLLCGGAFSLLGFIPGPQFDQMIKQAAQQNEQLAHLTGTERQRVQAWARFVGVAITIACISQVVLAVGVRRGNVGATKAGLVVTSAAFLFMIGMAAIRPEWIANMICTDGIFVVLVGVPVPFLVQALRAAPFVGQFQANYQAQYGQFLQQQQVYQQQYTMTPPPGYPAHGPQAYNAPAAGAATNTTQTGWQWQPPAGGKDSPHGQDPQA